MKLCSKISYIYNLLWDEPIIQNYLIENFKYSNPKEDDTRLISWVKDNIPLIPDNEKCVKIYAVALEKKENEIKREMQEKIKNPKITVKNYQSLQSKYGFVFKRKAWNSTYEKIMISDGIGKFINIGNYIIIDFQSTASYIVSELWQNGKLLEREILSQNKWQGLPLYHNTYKVDNIEPKEIDFTLKGQKKLQKRRKGMI